MTIGRIMAGLMLAVTISGCDRPEDPAIDAIATGLAWAESASVRRQSLEASLVNPDNAYSRLRLAYYDEENWGTLPLWNPPARGISIGESTPQSLEDGAPLEIDGVQWNREELLELGRKAFFEYPVQLAPALSAALDDPGAFGLVIDDEKIGAVVWVESPGGIFPSLTCASCHADYENGAWVPGRTNPRFDYGKVLDAYIGVPTVNTTWGPGRVDVTGDDRENPTFVTDLRPVAFQRRLHRAGTLYNTPMALAVRLETLLVTALSEVVRPPRKLVFALVVYLLSLSEALPAVPVDTPGRAIFDAQCADCHRGDGLVGDAISLDEIGTPPDVGLSSDRGTGAYRIPSLRGLGDRGALMADGSVPDLETLLDADRESPGHRFGVELEPSKRNDLLLFLRAL
jgi:hypothetical protein